MRISKLIILMYLNLSFENILANSPSGFLWYNEVIPKLKFKKSSKSPETSLPIWERNILALKTQFSNAQVKALDNPTLENVIAAQRLQQIIMTKSAKFADMWQLASLIDPELNDLNEPSNLLQKRIKEQENEKYNSDYLKELSKSWGLILQISPSCPACNHFAPYILKFAADYGFQLIAVSSEGKEFYGIEGVKDNGFLHASDLNPNYEVPILYLISCDGGTIYPIAKGITTHEKIIENIIALNKINKIKNYK